jgi:hypothetical protein
MFPRTTLPIRAPRVTVDDLGFAIDWLDAYEPTDNAADQANRAAIARLKVWLGREISKRERRAHAARVQRTVSR